MGADRAEASSRTNTHTANTGNPASHPIPTRNNQPRNPELYSTSPNCSCGKLRRPHKGRNRLLDFLPGSHLLQLGMHMDIAFVRSLAWAPVGCHLSLFTDSWTQITSNPWVLEAISGYKLELLGHPSQENPPGSIQLETTKAQILSQAVLDLASKGAIVPSNGSKDGYISQIFLEPKSNGSWRPVINLKSLNR